MAAVLLVAAGVWSVHALLGAGFVLDDWFLARNASFGGPTGVVDAEHLRARPGTIVAYGMSFGLFADQPGAVLAIQGAAFVGVALMAFILLRRFVSDAWALSVVLLWALMPNHLSIERWGSVLVADVGLLFLGAGTFLLMQRPLTNLRLVLACAAMAASCLSYEASILFAGLAFLAVPWWASGQWSWRAPVAGGMTLGAVGAWQVLNWHSVKSVGGGWGDFSHVFEAHLGWGITSWRPIAGLILFGTALASFLALRSLVRRAAGTGVEPPEYLLLTGWVVLFAGSLPFAAYVYEPVGAGDRVNYLSSWGGAMVVAGAMGMLARWRKEAGAVVACVLVVSLVATRLDRSQIWAAAARDAQAIVEGLPSRVDPACELIVVGPTPLVVGNVATFLDRSNIDAAVQFGLGEREARGRIATDEADFGATDPRCRVDIVAGSRLGDLM